MTNDLLFSHCLSLQASKDRLPSCPSFLTSLFVCLVGCSGLLIGVRSFLICFLVAFCLRRAGFGCIAGPHEAVARTFVGNGFILLVELLHRLSGGRQSCINACVISRVEAIDWSLDTPECRLVDGLIFLNRSCAIENK